MIMTAAFVASLVFGGSVQAGQFVVNGNFSSLSNGLGQMDYAGHTVATGWSTTPNYGYNFVMNDADVGSEGQYGNLSLWDQANSGASSWNGMSPNGDNYVAMDGAYENAPIAQTITGLTAGKTYDISFKYAFAQQHNYNNATIQHLGMNFGPAVGLPNTGYFPNVPTWQSANYDLPNHGFSGWMTYNGTVTATGTSDVLSFLAYGNLPVPPFALLTDVSLTSVPEPASWAMMIMGLGMVAFMARGRRSRTALPAWLQDAT
jgi:hypothetical protein